VFEYGANIHVIRVPDRSGRVDNGALGIATAGEYVPDCSYFGTTVGRFANRIENGRFVLDGQRYQATASEPPSHRAVCTATPPDSTERSETAHRS